MEDIKKNFSFSVKHQNKNYRVGLIQTHRGEINTPAFMPVGTQATVKGAFINDIIKTGSEIILSNTYHLMIRPGTERIEAVGGANSQFFICFGPTPHLDRQYTVFGKVIEGMEFVDMITKGDGPNGSVSNPDKIISFKSE